MNKSNPTCPEQNSLQLFLSEQLTDVEEQQTQEHLATCRDCQTRLERLVTRGRGWHEFREDLKDLSTTDLEDGIETESSLEALDLSNLLAPTDQPESLGRLGRYEILGLIGRGSAGIVFKGYESALNRYVAIKMLAPGLAFAGTSRKRFEREARAIAAVSHPNVIEVHGVDEFRTRPFIVMKYFPDGSLQRRIDKNGWMTTKEVCRIGMQVARGLSEAHRQGIVHRDIKPGNILLENGTERAVVSDFGLASVDSEVTMTRSGAIAGTPQFMSPEQARGKSLDVRTDLFSLGSVMYAACTGSTPFRGETLMGVIHNVCEQNPKSIRDLNPEIAPWLADLIQILLSKDPANRFQSAEEVDVILTKELAFLQMPGGVKPERSWMRNSRSNRRFQKPLVWASLICLALLLGLGAYAWTGAGSKITPQNEYGFVPTKQESEIFDAQAAYELAYRTHLREYALRGDMQNSIRAHQKALELGFDRPQSSYLLACAYSVERNDEAAFQWLEKAYIAGFHDYETAFSQPELARLKTDPRLISFLNRVEILEEKYDEAEATYFEKTDFKLAEQLYRTLLKECPQDEQAILMIAASLLEQGELDQAETWNEKARHSVRYANFGTYNLGCIAAQRGDFDLAFNYLEYSCELGFTDADHLENDPHLIPLRNDPRFAKLLKRIQQMDRGDRKVREPSRKERRPRTQL